MKTPKEGVKATIRLANIECNKKILKIHKHCTMEEK